MFLDLVKKKIELVVIRVSFRVIIQTTRLVQWLIGLVKKKKVTKKFSKEKKKNFLTREIF